MTDDQQHAMMDQSKYVTMKTAEREIGITRVTLRKYLNKLNITPRSFHIGDRSLYISRKDLERVKKLKQNPALLEQLRFQEP
jgi:predicted DNA-binding transcriptional regulator AlpA